KRPAQLVAPPVARAPIFRTRLGAGKLDEDDSALWQEGLRVPSEKKDTRDGRFPGACRRANFEEQLRQRAESWRAARLALRQIFVDDTAVKIVEGSAGHYRRLKVACALARRQLLDF